MTRNLTHLPPGWRAARVGDVCRIRPAGPGGGAPLRAGDVLVWEGSAVRAEVWEWDGRMPQGVRPGHLFRLRLIRPDLWPAFVAAWIEAVWIVPDLRERIFGGGHVHLSALRLAATPIPIPSLPEQHAISRVLSAARRVVDSERTALEALQEMRKALAWRLLVPDPIPEGWCTARLGDVADVIFGGDSPPASALNRSGRGVPFLQGNAEFGPVHPEPKRWSTHLVRRVPAGCVLLSIRGVVGDVNIADREYGIGRGLAAILPRDGLDPRFLFHFLRHEGRRLERLGVGSTFPTLRKRILEDIPIPIPPTSMQRAIADALDAVDRLVRAAEVRLRAAEGMFSALAVGLALGQIRPPAEVIEVLAVENV